MNKVLSTCFIVTLSALLATGCTWDRRDTGTAVGGVAGGLVGGAVSGGSAVGVGVGAVGGALIGNQVAR
ncbi:MAG: hypothetical protein ABI597_11645 [Gammaproteobacteria bacterium]